MKNSVYIGIGTSAGGLLALEKLIPTLPEDKGYTYIILQHLNPDKKSSLGYILSNYTSMMVSEAKQKCRFLPNNIYVIPAGFDMVIKNGQLELEKVSLHPVQATPSIDKAFESMAKYKGKDFIAIILSGAGRDGTEGIKKTKQYKGVTIAQTPDEALYKSMPQNAIDTQNIDYILHVEKIAAHLDAIIRASKNDSSDDATKALKSIRNMLIEKENLDISKYKNETILRRINNRMKTVHLQTTKDYVLFLKNNPDELYFLYQNILIGVTSFFRDNKAFLALGNELYKYLQTKPENYALRVWSIACSTGEEAYSLAILIDKISKKLHKKFNIHIFATDIDDKALNVARDAIYPDESLRDMDKKMLDDYFQKTESGYKVLEFIRKQIVFTHHNILSDPPFVNQDLLSCRNFLIYVLSSTQEEVFALLHYVLKENGILFLGSSESPFVSMKYFIPLNSEYKIYIKERLKNPPTISSSYFLKHLANKEDSSSKEKQEAKEISIQERISDAIFNFFSTDCIIVDKNMSIIYKKGKLPFLRIPDGFVTLNLLDNMNETLRYDVKRVSKLAFSSKRIQTSKFIEISLHKGDKIFVRILAYPYSTKNSISMLLLYFQQIDIKDLQFDTKNLFLPNESIVIQNLTTQITQMQEENHSLLDELTINKENMQLLNEELQSSNEELQSSNEELETSNEELQTSNEELHLSIRAKQVLQQQLLLILNSTHDGIIGLDINGNHTFVNDAALKILGFSKDELIGENAHKIWHHSKVDGSLYPFKKCSLHNHLIEGKSIRTEDLFWRKDGVAIEVEVSQSPIIEDKKVTGAVLSFRDITEQNKLKNELEREHYMGELYMNITGTIVMILDLNGNIDMINKEGCRLLKIKRSDAKGKNFIDNFIPKEIHSEIKSVFNSVVGGQTPIVSHYENAIVDKKGHKHIVAWTNNFIKDTQGNITGLITSGIDITKEKELSQKLFNQENIYKLTFEEADIGIAHATFDDRWIDTNEYLTKLLGYTKKEFKNISVSKITYKDDLNTDRILKKELLSGKKSSYHIEKRYIHKNGNIVWVSLAVVILRNEINKPMYFLKIIRDISQIKLLMYQLEAEKDKFKKIIAFTPIPIMMYNENGEIILTNKVFEKTIGFSQREISTMDIMIDKLFALESAKSIKQLKESYKKQISKDILQRTFVTKTGEKRVGIFNFEILYNTNTDNKNLYIIAIIDITDIQNKDELMMAQSRQAAMGDMLAMIAHQWRQPLSVISMVSNSIQAQMDLGEDITHKFLKQSMATLDEQTKYLSNTIDDFRDFFKPDKVKETLPLGEVFEKLTSLVQKSLEDYSITLEIPKKININISTHINQFIQVLLNLINNAKDAIKEKNISNGSIRITVSIQKDEVITGVCDNAGGIDPSVKDKLGQPYVTTKSKNGTGLGLYMSIIIVNKHLGGRLYWESNSVGSCFYIALPIQS